MPASGRFAHFHKVWFITGAASWDLARAFAEYVFEPRSPRRRCRNPVPQGCKTWQLERPTARLPSLTLDFGTRPGDAESAVAEDALPLWPAGWEADQHAQLWRNRNRGRCHGTQSCAR